ncbi:MAG: hypothetical protein LBS81_00980 [Endomicrobium sp.]|nr:hypothetical protein [Endomicrobium sp.]
MSTDIIGTKHIDISPGDAGFPELRDGDCISSQENSDMMSTLTNIADKINKALDNEKTAT